MSLLTSIPNRVSSRVRSMWMLLTLLALAASACNDGALFSPNRTDERTSLQLRPFYASLNASMQSADINVIRLTIKKLPSGPTTTQEFPVDPTQPSWNLPVEVPPNSDLEILIELVNRSGGTDQTVFSGKIDVQVTSGPQAPPPPVPVYPGPPENLNVTNVTITPRDQNMLEGDKITFTATAAGLSNPTVTWASLNSTVATVDANGVVTAKAPGQAIIAAFVGQKQDNVTVTVGPKATKVDLTPSTATLASFGADATFSARVLDVRNAVVPGLTVSYSIADPTIATQVSPGVFRARKNGTTTITASSVQGGTTISATASLTVQQKAVSVTINPTSASFNALGGTQQFTASAKDANNNDVSGLTFTWSTADANVATVDATGLLTAKGNGNTKVKVDAAGGSAEATVAVQQAAATLSVSPSSATLNAINAKVQLTGEVRDSRGNLMTTPITWVSAIPGIASVDASGQVTAVSDGPVVITATVGSLHAFTTVTVSRPVASVRMGDAHIDLNAGNSKQISATPVDANGFNIDGVAVTWASNKTSVASVSNTGLVTGVGAGDAEITAKAGGAFGTTTVTVKGTTGFHVNSNGKLLLLEADGGAGSFVASNIAATGAFNLSDITDITMSSTIPLTLAQLSAYGAIMVWTNFSPPNPVAWGDRLKEYVDAGGKVLLATYAYSVVGDPWYLQGGIMSHGYSPLINTNVRYNMFSSALKFPTALTSHPILAGVTEFSYGGNDNYVQVTLDTGATLVATDLSNIPLIAVNAAGNVIGFNLYPGNAFFKSAGVWKALGNALK